MCCADQDHSGLRRGQCLCPWPEADFWSVSVKLPWVPHHSVVSSVFLVTLHFQDIGQGRSHEISVRENRVTFDFLFVLRTMQVTEYQGNDCLVRAFYSCLLYNPSRLYLWPILRGTDRLLIGDDHPALLVITAENRGEGAYETELEIRPPANTHYQSMVTDRKVTVTLLFIIKGNC